MSEIAEQIVPIIAEKLGVNPSEVTMDASFTNDLGADSLDTVELMLDFDPSSMRKRNVVSSIFSLTSISCHRACKTTT